MSDHNESKSERTFKLSPRDQEALDRLVDSKVNALRQTYEEERDRLFAEIRAAQEANKVLIEQLAAKPKRSDKSPDGYVKPATLTIRAKCAADPRMPKEETEIFFSYKGNKHQGVIRPDKDGLMTVCVKNPDGSLTEYNSPSGAASAITGSAEDGWRKWCRAVDGIPLQYVPAVKPQVEQVQVEQPKQ